MEQKHYTLEEYNKESYIRAKYRDLCWQYNKIKPSDTKKKEKLLKKIVPNMGEKCKLTQPFFCEYGDRLILGDRVFINRNSYFGNHENVEIGDDTAIGPNCVVVTVDHGDGTLKTLVNRESIVSGIKIGKNVWIGANCTILKGVTIGDNSIVAAGAVVTKDVPSAVMVAGVPAQIKKYLK